MANLPESASYDAGVYQIETTDPVQGGVSGVANAPLKNLANRTAWLKQQVDALNSAQFASGTKLVFPQTSAPTGWTKDTNPALNHALRITGGTAGWGGSLPFTSAFASRGLSGTVQGHTLTVNEMPWHGHTVIQTTGGPWLDNPNNIGGARYANLETVSTGGAGGGWAHDHPLAMNNLDLSVQYVDAIIATKN